jgi:hypothetical protein
LELKQSQHWFYGIGIGFIILNIIALWLGFEWLSVLPFVALVLVAAVFRSDLLILFLSFIIPLSIEFDDIGGGLGISLPDEPLLILLTATVLFKFIIDGNYDYRIFKQPIAIAILINLGWLIFDTFFSQFVLVSVSRLPTITLGSVFASSNILASIAVVVVLPCVPEIAIVFLLPE